MLRRALALLLAATLVLGWTGVSAAAVCAKAAQAATTAGDGCKNCGEAGDQGQPRCPALACSGACAAGPMVALDEGASLLGPVPTGITGSALRDDGALIRVIRPDLPPPR